MIFDGMQEGVLWLCSVCDLQVDIPKVRGAKPVGGIHRIRDGKECTICSLVLDHVDTDYADAESSALTNYVVRAGIAEPTLADANYLLRHTFTDDVAYSIKRILLIAVKQNNVE